MATRILRDHFSKVRDELLAYSNHLGLAEHGDIKGLAREGFVREFLQRNLPSTVEYKTGEMIDHDDRRSGQLDVVLQMPTSPRLHLFGDLQLTLVDGAVGAIEVKSNLTTASWGAASHLRSALEASARVKALRRFSPIRGRMVGHEIQHHQTPFFVFAYTGCTKEHLLDCVLSYGKHAMLELDAYAPNLIVVLDRGYYMVRDDGWLWPATGKQFYFWEGPPQECLGGLFTYVCQLVQVYGQRPPATQLGLYFETDEQRADRTRGA